MICKYKLSVAEEIYNPCRQNIVGLVTHTKVIISNRFIRIRLFKIHCSQQFTDYCLVSVTYNRANLIYFMSVFPNCIIKRQMLSYGFLMSSLCIDYNFHSYRSGGINTLTHVHTHYINLQILYFILMFWLDKCSFTIVFLSMWEPVNLIC